MPKGTSFSPPIRSFIRAFADEIGSGTAAVFAGAGLSVSSGYVNWAELMRDIAEDLGLDVDRETNLVAIAQYHFNERGNRTRINQKILDEFSAGHTLNDNHEILASLPLSTYWTTNYDCMIEAALTKAGKIVDVKHNVDQLSITRRGRHAVLYKMHGDVSDPAHAVLTKDDYEGYFRDREPFVTALAGDLVSKTLLFLGFSFTDPNIDYVLSRVRVVLRNKPKQHYCMLRKEVRKPRERLEDYEYRLRQQSYFVKDLARLGIQALMIDDYSEISVILRAVAARYRSQTVFISGSASDFSPWKNEEAAGLIEALSGELIAKGFTIVTGFGLGVGPSVISGALQKILSNPTRYSRAQLVACPFPVDDGSAPSRRTLYRGHRESIMANAGIAVFLFGNKRSKGKIVPADGVVEEYEVAQALGLQIVAVGATGWVARKIWRDIAGAASKRSARFKRAFKDARSAGTDSSRIVRAVLTMVTEYRDVH